MGVAATFMAPGVGQNPPEFLHLYKLPGTERLPFSVIFRIDISPPGYNGSMK
jgi:hypothetical protein